MKLIVINSISMKYLQLSIRRVTTKGTVRLIKLVTWPEWMPSTDVAMARADVSALTKGFVPLMSDRTTDWSSAGIKSDVNGIRTDASGSVSLLTVHCCCCCCCCCCCWRSVRDMGEQLRWIELAGLRWKVQVDDEVLASGMESCDFSTAMLDDLSL